MKENAEGNEVTREMKLDLVNKIKKLSNTGLTELVEKVKEIKAKTITELPQEKIQIRIDDFEKPEFLVLQNFVEEVLMKEHPIKK